MESKILINNSFCKLQNSSAKLDSLVSKLLTTHNDPTAELASIFYRMNMLKRFGAKPKKGETRKAATIRTMATYQQQIKDLKDLEWVYWYEDGKFPTGHLNMVCDLLDTLKHPYKVVDLRKRIMNTQDLPFVKPPFDLRYYQKEMVDLGMEAGRGVLEASVGSGKTLIMTYLLNKISVNSLVVVPSRGLRDQIYTELANAFGTDAVQKVDSAMVRKGALLKTIKITTIQTLAALNKTSEANLILDAVEAIFFDEAHHSGSASFTKLLPAISHIYWRFSFSGTYLRNDSKSLDMWGILSNVLYRYPGWKAIDDGFLTPIIYDIHVLRGIKKARYPTEYDKNYCGGAEILSKILDIISENPDQQVLILVSKKDKSGLIIHEMLTARDVPNSYICGDNSEEEISETIREFNKKNIKVLIGSAVLGEGIDIRSTKHLILAQGGKSEINIVQAVGRLVRLFPGKEVGVVHDFRFKGTKYLEAHLELRINAIERNFKPQQIQEY